MSMWVYIYRARHIRKPKGQKAEWLEPVGGWEENLEWPQRKKCGPDKRMQGAAESLPAGQGFFLN